MQVSHKADCSLQHSLEECLCDNDCLSRDPDLQDEKVRDFESEMSTEIKQSNARVLGHVQLTICENDGQESSTVFQPSETVNNSTNHDTPDIVETVDLPNIETNSIAPSISRPGDSIDCCDNPSEVSLEMTNGSNNRHNDLTQCNVFFDDDYNKVTHL